MIKYLVRLDTLREIALTYLTVLVLAAGLFSIVEGVPFTDSLYWAGITGPTVGYGDVTPKTLIGKAISVSLAHIGVILVAMFTARLLLKVIHDENCFTQEEQKEMSDRLERKEEMLIELVKDVKAIKKNGK